MSWRFDGLERVDAALDAPVFVKLPVVSGIVLADDDLGFLVVERDEVRVASTLAPVLVSRKVRQRRERVDAVDLGHEADVQARADEGAAAAAAGGRGARGRRRSCCPTGFRRRATGSRCCCCCCRSWCAADEGTARTEQAPATGRRIRRPWSRRPGQSSTRHRPARDGRRAGR